MTSRITQQSIALVLAMMVTASVLAGLDVLAVSGAAALQAQLAQAATALSG